MKALAVVGTIVCMGLLSAAAFGDPVAEFYFSKSTIYDSGGMHVGDVPAEYGSGTMLTANVGETVYLWCRTPYQSTGWVSIALNITGDVTGGVMQNKVHGYVPPPPSWWTFRWATGSDFDPTDESINLVTTILNMMGTGYADNYSTWESDYVHRHFMLGWLDWGDIGYKWLSVAAGHVIRHGHSNSTVYFGFDETGARELGGSGWITGTTSIRPDILIIPEASSFALLALAALALRRR